MAPLTPSTWTEAAAALTAPAPPGQGHQGREEGGRLLYIQVLKTLSRISVGGISMVSVSLLIFLVVGVSLATQSSHGYFVGEMFFATFSLNNGATVVQHLPQTGASTVGSFVR